ncbi:MAG TPA: AAA family ATPase [Fluviicola sp.]|nr:AAA family ATPase [Fluviicola sp.]
MHITSVHVNDIKSIRDFKMEFDQPAGWHVIIGENGSGKSTIVKAIAFNLLGDEVSGLRIDFFGWLNYNSEKGQIIVKIKKHESDHESSNEYSSGDDYLITKHEFEPHGLSWYVENETTLERSSDYKKGNGWFSASYGPFRRFTGGISTQEYKSHLRLAAHLSIFGEDIALAEALDWLKELRFKQLDNKAEGNILDYIKALINSEGFLPHKAKLDSVNSDGVFFKDGHDQIISLNELSDGYRSILSLTFELIRQMVRVYGTEDVFRNIKKGDHTIPVPGVVLIDEIDAHLHPTWQTNIGQWFTKYFPNIQFIVTTHSPLICRAAEHGTIWRLAAPGSNYESGQIIGSEKDKLVFGNILDAYGTEAFGTSPVRSTKSDKKLERLGELNMLSALGKINPLEEEERLSLQKTLSTDDPIGL